MFNKNNAYYMYSFLLGVSPLFLLFEYKLEILPFIQKVGVEEVGKICY